MLTWGPGLLLWLGALHLHKKWQLPPAAAHLCVLLGSLLLLSAAAMLNVLPYTAAALLLAALLATLWDLSRQGPKAWCAGARAFLTRPVLFALAAAALLTVAFAIQKPIFTYWDEFLITGINAKVMDLSDLMYRVAESPAASLEDPCGTAVLSYLYQFFSPGFSESDLYLSYGWFYFAVFAAAAEQVEQRGAGRRAGGLFFLALALTPFLQGYHIFGVDYSEITLGYASCLADYMLAVGMFACLVLYLAAPAAHWYWAAMAFTSLLKESGVLFAAVMAAVLAVWRLPARGAGRRAWLRWAASTALDLAAAAAGYLVWLVYLPLSGSPSPLPGLVAAAVLAAGALLRQLLGKQRRAACKAAAARLLRKAAAPLALLGSAGLAAVLLVLRFSGRFAFASGRIGEAMRVFGGLFVPSLRAGMWQTTLDMEIAAFFQERIFYPLQDWMTVALLCLMVLAGCLLAHRGAYRLRLLLTQAVLCLGAVAYLITMAYYVAHHVETQGLMEYPRYFTGYLFGWVYIVFFLLLTAPGRVQWRQFLAMACAVACVCGVALIGWDHTVIAAPQNYQQQVRRVRRLAEEAAAVVQPGERVYLIVQSLDSYSGLVIGHALYPVLVNCARVDTNLDYGIIFCAERDPDDPYSNQYYQATAEEFAAIIQRNFDYVLVGGDNGVYERDYGALFGGGFEIGGLYRVTDDAATPFERVQP